MSRETKVGQEVEMVFRGIIVEVDRDDDYIEIYFPRIRKSAIFSPEGLAKRLLKEGVNVKGD